MEYNKQDNREYYFAKKSRVLAAMQPILEYFKLKGDYKQVWEDDDYTQTPSEYLVISGPTSSDAIIDCTCDSDETVLIEVHRYIISTLFYDELGAFKNQTRKYLRRHWVKNNPFQGEG